MQHRPMLITFWLDVAAGTAYTQSPFDFLWQLLMNILNVCKAMTILQPAYSFYRSVACALAVLYTIVELPESLH